VDQPESKIARLRRRRPGIDHLIRAFDAYTERYGDHFAASVTYFSVLSLFPLLLIGFAIVGFVLAGQPDTLNDLRASITDSAPEGLRDLLNQLVDGVVTERGKVGVIGLIAAAYTGFGWMSNLRDALTAQWGQKPVQQPILRWIAVDLLALLGLGAAIVVSFGLSAVGSGAADSLLDKIGIGGYGWARFLLVVITTLLSLAANWLVFLWLISRLPRTPVNVRSAMRGALAAAIGFEVLKTVATIYLNVVIGGPLGSLVGPIVGLLVFANLVSRFLLFITAWTATAQENLISAPIAPPGPAVIRPDVHLSRTPRVAEAAGLMGIGALLALVWRRKRL
jgi:membrane protein